MKFWNRINGFLNHTGRFIGHSGKRAGRFIGNTGDVIAGLFTTKKGLATLAVVVLLPFAFRFSGRGGGRDGRVPSTPPATVAFVDREEAAASRPRAAVSIIPRDVTERQISQITPSVNTPTEEAQMQREAKLRAKIPSKIAKLDQLIQGKENVYALRSLTASDMQLAEDLAELDRLKQAKQRLQEAASDPTIDFSTLNQVYREASFVPNRPQREPSTVVASETNVPSEPPASTQDSNASSSTVRPLQEERTASPGPTESATDTSSHEPPKTSELEEAHCGFRPCASHTTMTLGAEGSALLRDGRLTDVPHTLQCVM